MHIWISVVTREIIALLFFCFSARQQKWNPKWITLVCHQDTFSDMNKKIWTELFQLRSAVKWQSTGTFFYILTPLFSVCLSRQWVFPLLDLSDRGLQDLPRICYCLLTTEVHWGRDKRKFCCYTGSSDVAYKDKIRTWVHNRPSIADKNTFRKPKAQVAL